MPCNVPLRLSLTREHFEYRIISPGTISIANSQHAILCGSESNDLPATNPDSLEQLERRTINPNYTRRTAQINRSIFAKSHGIDERLSRPAMNHRPFGDIEHKFCRVQTAVMNVIGEN